MYLAIAGMVKVLSPCVTNQVVIPPVGDVTDILSKHYRSFHPMGTYSKAVVRGSCCNAIIGFSNKPSSFMGKQNRLV